MGYRTVAKNLMLDALGAQAATASLHTGFPATDANELSGGSPAYARKPIAYSPATGGVIDDTEVGGRVFDIPAATTVAAVAIRAADGTILVDFVPTSGSETFAGQGQAVLTDSDLDLNAV